jgi:hypothetical protein
MGRSWRALLVVVAVLLGTFGVMTFAVASPTDRTTVLHLQATVVEETFIDTGEEGFSIGDQAVASQDLTMGGRRVGTQGYTCQVTRTGEDPRARCVAVYELPRGQVTVQALIVPFADDATFAITGGTGAYRDAGGYGTVHNTSPTSSEDTLFIDNLGD